MYGTIFSFIDANENLLFSLLNDIEPPLESFCRHCPDLEIIVYPRFFCAFDSLPIQTNFLDDKLSHDQKGSCTHQRWQRGD